MEKRGGENESSRFDHECKSLLEYERLPRFPRTGSSYVQPSSRLSRGEREKKKEREQVLVARRGDTRGESRVKILEHRRVPS